MADFEIKFIDNTLKVKSAIKNNALAVLEECVGELESQTKRNTRVDTGKTKSDWIHTVSENSGEFVGSNNQNAIWEEFGTGEHALAGNGRKGGWWYRSEKDGKLYFTKGKTPSRALFKAFSGLKNKIINHIQNSFKGL